MGDNWTWFTHRLIEQRNKRLRKVQTFVDIILFLLLYFAFLFELPKQSNVETYIPLFRIYSNCIWFSCHAREESCTVRSIQLTYIDGVSQTSPMSCIVAEPMHSGMISPVDISSNPVNGNAPRSFEFWTLKGTDVNVRFMEMIFHSSCIVTDLCNLLQLSNFYV